MKPTTDIVEELRLYNRWRRGDEAITAPDPTALGKLLDDAADRIEHLFASGIQTCHADCQRPMCVLRRERDKAHANLAQVTAERDDYRDRIAGTERDIAAALDETHTLRASVAELDQKNMILRGAVEAVAAQREQVEQRYAELVAALRDVRASLGVCAAFFLAKFIDKALARAESATPALKPEGAVHE